MTEGSSDYVSRSGVLGTREFHVKSLASLTCSCGLKQKHFGRGLSGELGRCGLLEHVSGRYPLLHLAHLDWEIGICLVISSNRGRK